MDDPAQLQYARNLPKWGKTTDASTRVCMYVRAGARAPSLKYPPRIPRTRAIHSAFSGHALLRIQYRVAGVVPTIYALRRCTSAMRFFQKLFEDKRLTTALLLTWMVIVCTIFYSLGAFHMAYMHVGPGPSTVFMGLTIDTWGKWSALAFFSFVNTCVNEFISNSLDPWMLNTIQDHKTRTIPYSSVTCMWIVQMHCMYMHVMAVFALFLFFSQVDFAVIRLLADWLVTGVSTAWFLQDKEPVCGSTASSVEMASGKRQCFTIESDDDGDHSSEDGHVQSSAAPVTLYPAPWKEKRKRKADRRGMASPRKEVVYHTSGNEVDNDEHENAAGPGGDGGNESDVDDLILPV